MKIKIDCDEVTIESNNGAFSLDDLIDQDDPFEVIEILKNASKVSANVDIDQEDFLADLSRIERLNLFQALVDEFGVSDSRELIEEMDSSHKSISTIEQDGFNESLRKLQDNYISISQTHINHINFIAKKYL